MLGKIRARRSLLTGWHPRDVDDMLFYGVFGVILGGRLGYVLFYKPLYYLAHPLEIFQVWAGGMSFHGGFLGVLVALWLFARKRAASAGSTSPTSSRRCVRSGLAAGRLGNFINGELVGPRDRRAVGDGVSAGRQRCRAIRRSSTSSRSKACCCS